MSETPAETTSSDQTAPATEQDNAEERREIDEVQQELDAEADGDGLAAEAGRGEEEGLSEG